MLILEAIKAFWLDVFNCLHLMSVGESPIFYEMIVNELKKTVDIVAQLARF